MSSLINVVLIAAVVALVVVRQARPRRVATGGRGMFVAPAVLVLFSLRQPGLLDADDRALSLVLLAAELVVGVAMGVGWARTSRLWADENGTVWSKGTRATLVVWVAGIAVRLGLMGVGALLGVHQGSGALMLALASSVLVRGVLLARRAPTAAVPGGPGEGPVSGQDAAPEGGGSYGGSASYGGGGAPAPWKDRV
ncbi:DUF1453 domain-containing protein [Streptomyces sp. NPDC059096]|uniref:DUF1453 domain-containing protein n=1 Tax=unclassified Streptomyces TaxID=2593676 RepID=UPI0036908E4E